MSRTAAAAATVIAVLMAGAPVLAQTAPEARVAPVAQPARVRSDEATRTAYERRDALSR